MSVAVESLATGRWLDRARIVRIGLLCLLASAVMIGWTLLTAHGTLDARGRPLGTDFSNVWTAGRMVLDGRAPAVWSWPDHFAVQRAVHGKPDVDLFGWHYPPPFLLVATALATMPYVTALIVWQLATLLPFLWLLHRMVPRRETILLALAAPVTMICLLHGHNGFLTALLLGGGLFLLERRPLAAGLLLGCLIYKPQFALVIPVLLLAARQWRAILGACLSAGLLVAVTMALWGWPVWAAFLDSLPLTRSVVIEQGATGFHKIMTPFGAVRGWGGAIALAYAVQSLTTLAVVALTAWVGWRERSNDRRGAWTCAAVLLSTPYALDYDFVVLLPALAFLWRDGERSDWNRWDRSLLAAAWVAPLFARAVAEYLLVPLGLLSVVAVAAVTLRRMTATPGKTAARTA